MSCSYTIMCEHLWGVVLLNMLIWSILLRSVYKMEILILILFVRAMPNDGNWRLVYMVCTFWWDSYNAYVFFLSTSGENALNCTLNG